LEDNASGSFGATNFIHPKALNGVQFEIFQPSGTFEKLKGDSQNAFNYYIS
jgi:hypothetical protein